MGKTNLLHRIGIVLFVAFMAVSVQVSAQAGGSDTYRVLIAAYNQKVPLTYFRGLDNVFETNAYNNSMYRYYVGGLSKADAETVLSRAKELGFDYARVVAEEDIQERAKQCCIQMEPVATRDVTIFGEGETVTVQHVFFDFDKSNLRPDGINQLNKLYRIMTDNPNYSVELQAHTDAKGTDSYNIALAQRRKNSVKQYLVNKGISASRITYQIFGESKPIARNTAVDGNDSPAGRQFNRRVELVVQEQGQAVNVVEEIIVPEYLQTSN